MKKKISSLILSMIIIANAFVFQANADFGISSDIKSAILIEPVTGTVLYEQNPDEKLPPASVTKVMTALLVMEAIDSGKITYDDDITVSAEASAMGGSQIFLEVGEKIKVHELLKGLMVASGNDAAVAFAEYIGGTESNFVDMMNKRAEELGMKNTHFMNCHGLDADNHYSSARDIGIMSAELINNHPDIIKYSSIWTDTIRNGKTSLANTNKLVRFYEGCDGLKTGSTSIAKCCLSATAERNGMRLIAVIMAAPTTDTRFAAARQLFDYGFAIKEIAEIKADNTSSKIKVLGGTKDFADITYFSKEFLVSKGSASKIDYVTTLEECVKAPVSAGQIVGKVSAVLEGKEIFSSDIVITEDVERIKFWSVFANILSRIYGKS